MTINKINNLVLNASNQLRYDRVSDAADTLVQAYLETNATKIGLVNRQQFGGFQSITRQTDYPLQKMVLGNSIASFTEDTVIENIYVNPADVEAGFRFYEAPAPAWQSNTAGAGANGISGDGVVGANPHFGTKADIVDNPFTYLASESMNVRADADGHTNRIISSGSLQSIQDVLKSLDGSVGPWTKQQWGAIRTGFMYSWNTEQLIPYDTKKLDTLFPLDTHVIVTDDDVEAVQKSVSPIL